MEVIDIHSEYERAVDCAERGKYVDALNIYEKLLTYPYTPSSIKAKVYNDMGVLSYNLDDTARAEHFLIKAIFEDILSTHSYWNLIRIVEGRIKEDYKFSIIISTYNRCSVLKRCIDSLRENSYFKLEIIIVADPCNDGTIEYLETEKASRDTVVVINDSRIGHSKSLNKGVRLATGDYVAFFNDDIVVMPGWDLFVVLTIDEHDDVGCGIPLVIYPDGKVQSAGEHVPYRSPIFHFIGQVPYVDTSPVAGKYIRDFLQFQVPREVDYGYIPVMKRGCFERNGLVDERFERYFIDPDQGYRIQQTGYKNIYCPTSVLIHYELSKRDDVDTIREIARMDMKRFADKWKLYDIRF